MPKAVPLSSECEQSVETEEAFPKRGDFTLEADLCGGDKALVISGASRSALNAGRTHRLK